MNRIIMVIICIHISLFAYSQSYGCLNYKYIPVLQEGDSITIDNIPDIKNWYNIGCSFTTNSTFLIRIFKSQFYWSKGDLEIDNKNIKEYKRDGYDIIPHGLDIKNGVVINIIKEANNARIILTNLHGNQVSHKLNNWNGSRGGIIRLKAIQGTCKNLSFSFGGSWYNKQTWIFGDSYANLWPIHCYKKGYTNFALDAYLGRNSPEAYKSLITALKYGKPQNIVWMMGMNDKDTKECINNKWKETLEKVIELCKNNNIRLILCTIPNVPERIHIHKNNYIRNSKFSFIDLASILGANDIKSSWHPGLLSKDKVHPTEAGAVIIASMLTASIPDMYFDPKYLLTR